MQTSAVDIDLGNNADLERVAPVFKAWLGDRASYSGFDFGELDWLSDSGQLVGINPKMAMRLPSTSTHFPPDSGISARWATRTKCGMTCPPRLGSTVRLSVARSPPRTAVRSELANSSARPRDGR